jgi:glycine/D-amino acid oxidase-like deaminating enzyme
LNATVSKGDQVSERSSDFDTYSHDVDYKRVGKCGYNPNLTDYRKYSFWLETAGEELKPRSALERSGEVDVAVLGAGYSGLWTAYYLLRDSPGLRVAVVEKEIAGFGASGRNGGWCSPKFPVTPGMLEERYGLEAARSLLLAMYGAVDEVGRVCEEEHIDAHFYKGGALSLARGAHQLPSIQSARAAYERLGLADRNCLLSAEETRERVKVSNVHGALYTPGSASVHPGRLVRGLTRAVERRGGVVYEQTEVVSFEGGATPRLVTRGGELRAQRAIVLAGEGYLSRLPQLHRAIMPVYSLIVLTERLSDAQWSQIGWQNRESIGSNKYTVDYLTRTADGRILFGSRGAPYVFGSKITDGQDRHEPTHERARRAVVEWFPSLEGIRFTHAWGGPLGMPRDWMPGVQFDPAARIGTARGYTGQGVATTNLAGRILADLIMGKQSELATLPMAQRRSRNWEPEPLRWIAVRYMQDAFARIDAAAENGQSGPIDAPIAELLGKH